MTAGKPENRTRLKEIAAILTRHEIVRGVTPEKLRLIIEDLGPTYIKLGQLMSMRPDALPAAYCRELAKLRSEVKPMPLDEVRRVVEEAMGLPLEEAFPSFEAEPLGSASIAQAHRAVLADGSRVVVKVQREGAYEVMSRDVSLLRRAVGLARHSPVGEVVDFGMVLDELWAVAQEELDFLTEAQNAQRFCELNSGLAYVGCPVIYRHLTTPRVLVMEYVDGYAVNNRAALLEAGYDLEEIGGKLVHHYLKQVIEDGFFHADPHPGNIRIREGKIVWIDFGMMGRLSPHDQTAFGRLVSALAGQDAAAVKEALLSMGQVKGPVDQARLYADLDEMMARYGSADWGDMDLSLVIEDMLALCHDHRIGMPRGFSLLARGMATLEGVAAEISPNINVFQAAGEIMTSRLLTDFDWRKELQSSARAVAASGRKALDLPALAADWLRLNIRGQSRVNMELSASQDLVRTAASLVDKLIGGILIAALLVASSLLCTTNMEPQILNIPALGAAGYLGALVLFVWLVWRRYAKKKK